MTTIINDDLSTNIHKSQSNMPTTFESSTASTTIMAGNLSTCCWNLKKKVCFLKMKKELFVFDK